MVLSPAIRKHFASALFPVLGAGVLLMPFASFAAGQKVEKHFAVKGRPVVMIQNVANGRIEVKSWKNPEVVVSASQPSNKIGLDMEQADNRIDVTASVLDSSAQESDLSENIQLTVPVDCDRLVIDQIGARQLRMQPDLLLTIGEGSRTPFFSLRNQGWFRLASSHSAAKVSLQQCTSPLRQFGRSFVVGLHLIG